MRSGTLQRLLCEALAAHLSRPGRPDLPAGGDLFWRWFADLSAGRTWSVAGPAPIAFGEVEAYRRLTGWPIEERHLRILRAMDEVFLDHFRRPTGERTVAARPMTAGLFDALFG
jgi:hypothetical protein